jgi:hypothetical protein
MTYRRPSKWIAFNPDAKPPSVDEIRRRDEMRRKLTRLCAIDTEAFEAALGRQVRQRFGPEAAKRRSDAEAADLLVGIIVAQHRNPKLSAAAWIREEAERLGMSPDALKKRLEAARRRYQSDRMFEGLVIAGAHEALHPPPGEPE